MMSPYLQLLRVKQWIKNIFVVAPLIFSGQLIYPDAIVNTVVATVLFCLSSSIGYIFNDIHDIEQDRQHPEKSRARALASGKLTIKQAIILMVILAAITFTPAYLFNPKLLYALALYIALTGVYTIYLKHIAIVDIFTIAAGFVLRIYAGAVTIAVPVSGWMFITSFTLALYLAAIKRKQELAFGKDSRPVLKLYSESLIQKYAEMSATGALVFYSLFVMTEKPQLIITIPLVLFGLFRYWYVVEVYDAGESPADALFQDGLLTLTIVLWAGLSIYALWP